MPTDHDSNSRIVKVDKALSATENTHNLEVGLSSMSGGFFLVAKPKDLSVAACGRRTFGGVSGDDLKDDLTVFSIDPRFVGQRKMPLTQSLEASRKEYPRNAP